MTVTRTYTPTQTTTTTKTYTPTRTPTIIVAGPISKIVLGMGSVSTDTPSPTLTPPPTPVLDRSLPPSMVAAPNISTNGEPIKFLVNLAHPAPIVLSLYTLAGERVYDTGMQGSAGLNTLVWNLANNQNQPVASGLYLFVLQTGDGSKTENQVGKVIVIH
jgi:hypothetical protein